MSEFPEGQVLREGALGYPPRAAAADPDGKIRWIGEDPPALGPDEARDGDQWIPVP